MKFLMLMLAVASVATAQTNDLVKVKVTGDHVSLRFEPSATGEFIDRTMRGDELIYLDKTNGWVAVQAPDSLDFWTAAEYIKVDPSNPELGTVTAKALNVRSGPSRNYNVMAEVKRDQQVQIRGEHNSWLKIAPPVGARLWISEDYVEMVKPPMPEPVVAVEEEKQEPNPVVEVKKEAPQKAEDKPLKLVLDDSRQQGKVESIPGVLRRANPGLYKLVLIAGDIEEPICLVRGREAQLDQLLNRMLLIEGKMYWAKDVDLPILQPDKINKNPILTE